MPQFGRRSLLVQLLSVYLLFVAVVLIGGLGVNAIIEQKLRTEVQASDQALAQEIALNTGLQLEDSESAIVVLSQLIAHDQTPVAITNTIQAFKAARTDVDYVYLLDPLGALRGAWPANQISIGAEFSPPDVVQRARESTRPIFEVGIAIETTSNPSVIIAEPMRDASGQLTGIVAASLSLVELSDPLTTVVQAQQRQGRQLMISIIDNRGELIATPEHKLILQTVLDELPGAEQALQGQPASRLAPGPDGQDWLFSAVPISNAGWAVVVQRPSNEALAIVSQFHIWLITAALLFTFGGLLFWLLLLSRVIRPLHLLASQHQALPASEHSIPLGTSLLAGRADEVGDLARSLMRLERDGLEKLQELRTLLETSNAVVGSLEPYTVVSKIIREVRRLVDVQAVAVLLPDDLGVLHVLASDGHSQDYDDQLALSSRDASSAAVLALRDSQPVQKLLTAERRSFSYEEGFRTVLAIPIISRHAGGVVLLVHRIKPQLFDQEEIDLLLTFANYATLAWEHAILYERSDERLREVAGENARLYQQASSEKQRLEAIMGSLRDGLVLTSIDGMILYANQGAHALAELPNQALEGHPIGLLYTALRLTAVDPELGLEILARMEHVETTEALLEIRQHGQLRAIDLHLFDVNNEVGSVIGRGLLLRDVTREHELNEFKTTLLAAVGHEVRTPLTAIKGYASTLLQDDVDWPLADQRHFLRTISGEADRLALLVSNLLDLSRQEAGLLEIKRVPFSISELITDMLTRLGSQTTIDLEIPTDLPFVAVDRSRIEVVLQNLVSNALVYGDGEVRITARQQGDELVIAITDNGPGIAPEELSHVFERFYRARHGRQSAAGGTGLGLAISKAFIEAHGGRIWAKSGTQGTTLAFSLPIVASTATTTCAEHSTKDDAYDHEDQTHSARRR